MAQSYMLEFVGGGSTPVQYEVNFDGIEYYIRFRHGWLEVYADSIDFNDDDVRLSIQIGDDYDGYWNSRETNVYLTLLSHSIQTGEFNPSDFPHKDAAREHSFYSVGRYPLYPVGLTCGFNEPSPPPEGAMNRHVRRQRRDRGIHDHEVACTSYVHADEVEAWIADNPKEHEAFKRVYPAMWREVAREMGFAT